MTKEPVSKTVWVGRVLSILPSLLFLFSGVMKLVANPEDMAEGMTHLGIPTNLVVVLAIIELTSVLIYLIPPTAMLGAILLTGYMGGAIFAHLRVGDPVYIQIVVGMVVWLGFFLRNERLRTLLPITR